MLPAETPQSKINLGVLVTLTPAWPREATRTFLILVPVSQEGGQACRKQTLIHTAAVQASRQI